MNALFFKLNPDIQILLEREDNFTKDVFIFIPADQLPDNIPFLKKFFKLILEHSIHLLIRGMVFRQGWLLFILFHVLTFFQIFIAII